MRGKSKPRRITPSRYSHARPAYYALLLQRSRKYDAHRLHVHARKKALGVKRAGTEPKENTP